MLRRVLIGLNGFLAVTAVAGGIGLLTGVIAMPVELLRSSPFPSYTVPGLALAIAVGGTAIAAVWLLSRRHPLAPAVSIVSGIAIIGFEVVEVLAIGSPPGAARGLQLFYGALGLVMVALGYRLAVAARL